MPRIDPTASKPRFAEHVTEEQIENAWIDSIILLMQSFQRDGRLIASLPVTLDCPDSEREASTL